MKALGWWLMFVGSLRLASVWFGFFNIWALRLGVFSNTTMTEVHGRTFGVWTLLTCTICFLCAFNLSFFFFLKERYKLININLQVQKAQSPRGIPLSKHFLNRKSKLFGSTHEQVHLLSDLCAFNLDNKPLYLATFLSFIYAFGHFLTEYLVYQTMAIGNLTMVGIFAGTAVSYLI